MGFSIQSADTTATQESYTTIVNSVVTQAFNEAVQICSSDQTFRVVTGEIPAYTFNGQTFPSQPCDFTAVDTTINISQTVAQECDLDSVNYNTLETSLRANLTNQLNQWINNNFNANQGWLAIAFASQAANNISTQEVATRISNSVSANFRNQCQAELTTTQNGEVVLCGVFKNDTININQRAAITNLTSCINKNTISVIANDTQLNGMAQTADDQLATTQEGIFSPLRWLIIGAVVIAALIIIGVVLYLLFGGSKTAVKPSQLPFVSPKVRACAAEAKRRLLEEGRLTSREAESFLIKRCLTEKRRESEFENNRERFEMRPMERERE